VDTTNVINPINGDGAVVAKRAAKAPARKSPSTQHQIRGAESPRKVLQVLMAFDQQRPFATISELADEVGVPLSTCYRYVGLLREVGLLEEGERATYHVTPQIMRIARAAQLSNTLCHVARPYLEEVCAHVNETVVLMQAFGTRVVCVDTVAPPRAMRFQFEPGQSVPIGDGASGRLLLAYLPDAERLAHIARRASTEVGFAHRAAVLEQDLPKLARQGWATSLAEIEDGVWACSVAVRDGKSVPAAVAVAGPSFRIDPKLRDEIRRLLIEASAAITSAREGLR
jgi:DNA-binding IclR family transcriptional regulator